VRHADYIGSWLEVLREDDRAIVRAASAASKAADYLLAFAPGGEVAKGSADTAAREASEMEFGLTQRCAPENPATMSGCDR
jgi:antirestriction protein ArdC